MKKFLIVALKYFILFGSMGFQIYNYFHFKNMLQPEGSFRMEVLSVYMILLLSLTIVGFLIVDLLLYKDDIKEWFHKLFRSIKWGIRMWGNHNFDHAYFLQTIKWKLEDMLKFYSSDYPISGEAWKVKDDLEHAIYYLELIMDEENTKDKRFLHPIYSDFDCSKCTWKGNWLHEPTEQKYKDKGCKIWHPPHLICNTCMDNGLPTNQRKSFFQKQRKQFELENKQFFDFIAERYEFWWD